MLVTASPSLCDTMPAFNVLSRIQQWLQRRTFSVRHRITGAFLLLTLVSGTVLCLSAGFSYQFVRNHVIRWHLDPIMRLLITAENSGELRRSGERITVSSAALARTLRVHWYVDDRIPKDLRPDRSRVRELVRVKSDSYALTYRMPNGRSYAVVGKIKDIDELEKNMTVLALGCVVASLTAAAILAFWLSRKISRPLLNLAAKIKEGSSLENTPLYKRTDEVGQLARAFAGRECELRKFLNREQLFTGDVSHELRTPLTVLQGGVEILESRLAPTAEAPQLLPVITRMQRTITSMTATVNTMLLLARKPEQLEQRMFNISDLLRQEVEYLRTGLTGRPVTLHCTIPEHLAVFGNPQLAAMIVHNLLENAHRYTERGSISLYLAATHLCVEDTSPHIEPDVRDRMFQRGTRGNDSTPGSGLGLALVLRGCEHMGWQIRHELWEQGNRFRIIFSQTDVFSTDNAIPVTKSNHANTPVDSAGLEMYHADTGI